MRSCPIIAVLSFAPVPALADAAEIVGAEIEPRNGGYTVSVTLRHADTGWDDYADGWRVELENGTVLAVRELAHPHVEEQPFTRATSGVEIPEGTDRIHIRARTLTTGWAETRLAVPLP